MVLVGFLGLGFVIPDFGSCFAPEDYFFGVGIRKL